VTATTVSVVQTTPAATVDTAAAEDMDLSTMDQAVEVTMVVTSALTVKTAAIPAAEAISAER